ncbi:amidohydrolase family protein, partial [Sulfuracidifex metallicus]|uniref:amidohydrolase family protein n=1 Tax=Sulfuracidifex metallicus TaxID=47303 RepID=UPI002273D779
ALSHITSTHYHGASFFNLVNKLRETEVSIVVNPETNLYLQGRYASINIPRGMARVNYLLKRGVNVSLGSDNVSDVVYPLGTFNMIRVMEICRTAEYNCPLKVVTENGFRTINVNPPVIKEGEKAQLVVLRHDESSLHYMPLLVLNGRNYVINNIKPEIGTVD